MKISKSLYLYSTKISHLDLRTVISEDLHTYNNLDLKSVIATLVLNVCNIQNSPLLEDIVIGDMVKKVILSGIPKLRNLHIAATNVEKISILGSTVLSSFKGLPEHVGEFAISCKFVTATDYENFPKTVDILHIRNSIHVNLPMLKKLVNRLSSSRRLIKRLIISAMKLSRSAR